MESDGKKQDRPLQVQQEQPPPKAPSKLAEILKDKKEVLDKVEDDAGEVAVSNPKPPQIVTICTAFGYAKLDLKQLSRSTEQTSSAKPEPQVDSVSVKTEDEEKQEPPAEQKLNNQNKTKSSQSKSADRKPEEQAQEPKESSSLQQLEIKQIEDDEEAKFNEKVERETRELDARIAQLTARFENAQTKIVHCSLLKGGDLYTQRRNIKTKITVYIKVFHGERKLHRFEVSILDTIQTLLNKLQAIEPREMKQYYEMKLIYPMGHLRNISSSPSDTFIDQQLPDGAKLVLVGKRSFTWDPNAKGANINLLNGNLTANKKQEVDYQTVLGAINISSGSHYWEIKIEKFVELDDIIIGVSLKGIDLNQRPFDTGKFWGWICTGGRKIYPSSPGGPTQAKEYGGCAKIGDVVGVHLEIKGSLGFLTFYKNGSSLGTCFNNLPAGQYCPTACLYYGEVQITLNPSARLPDK